MSRVELAIPGRAAAGSAALLGPALPGHEGFEASPGSDQDIRARSAFLVPTAGNAIVPDSGTAEHGYDLAQGTGGWSSTLSAGREQQRQCAKAQCGAGVRRYRKAGRRYLPRSGHRAGEKELSRQRTSHPRRTRQTMAELLARRQNPLRRTNWSWVENQATPSSSPVWKWRAMSEPCGSSRTTR